MFSLFPPFPPTRPYRYMNTCKFYLTRDIIGGKFTHSHTITHTLSLSSINNQ